MTEQEYRAAPGISQSELKHILISPAHYRWAKANPLEQTEAVLMGTLLHSLVLEGCVPNKYFRPPGMSFSKADGKSWLKEKGFDTLTAYEKHLGHPLLEQSCLDTLLAMQSSLMAHPFVGPILCDPKTEKEVSGTSIAGGFAFQTMKGRADMIAAINGKIIGLDIKKVQKGKANSRAFTAMACDEDRELAFQAAYYVDIFDLEGFVFIAVEDEPFELDSAGQNVHRVEVYEVSPDTIEYGRKQYRRALELLAECERTNMWTGAPRDVKVLHYPDWKLAK